MSGSACTLISIRNPVAQDVNECLTYGVSINAEVLSYDGPSGKCYGFSGCDAPTALLTTSGGQVTGTHVYSYGCPEAAL